MNLKTKLMLITLVALFCGCLANEGGGKITNLGKIVDEPVVHVWWAVKAEEKVYLGLGIVERNGESVTSFVEFHPPNRIEKLLSVDDLGQREAAVWDGERVLIFGGSTVEDEKYLPTDQILSFDPKSRQLKVLNTSLPYPTSDLAVVWGDGRAYVFMNNSERCEVYAFYPNNASLVRMSVSCLLDHPGGCTHSVVWYDGKAYFFCEKGLGSFDPMNGYRWIKYTDKVWVRAVAVADGYIFAIGGSSGIAETKEEIFRFNPKTGELCEMESKLPLARGQSVAIGDDHIYVFGGYTEAGYANEVLRYDYRSDRCVED